MSNPYGVTSYKHITGFNIQVIQICTLESIKTCRNIIEVKILVTRCLQLRQLTQIRVSVLKSPVVVMEVLSGL